MSRQAPRPRGTGSIFHRRRSSYWWIKYYRNGRPYWESTRTTEKKKALQFLRRRLAEIYQDNFYGPASERIRVEDLAEDFLRDYRINGRKSVKKAEYRWRMHLQPFFAQTRVVDITSELINRYVDKHLQENAARATVNRELAALKRMFRLGAMQTPPKVLRMPVIPHLRETNIRIGFVDDTEYERLAGACEELWQHALLVVAYNYGWRGCEIRDLLVNQVNLLDRTIRLDPFTTKNDEGRLVPVTDEVFAVLCECCRGKEPNDYVLTRPNGHRVKSYRGWWERLRGKAGLPHLYFHDLRRSAARNLRKAGVSEKVIMKICGWKTRSVFDRYNIVSESDLQDAARLMERRRKLCTKTGQFGDTYGDTAPGAQALPEKQVM